MEKVTISQLKNSLSAYLKKVRAGQTVLILDRNEPIAVLERVNKTSLSDDERLARLEQSGLIKRSKTSNRSHAAARAVSQSSSNSLVRSGA